MRLRCGPRLRAHFQYHPLHNLSRHVLPDVFLFRPPYYVGMTRVRLAVQIESEQLIEKHRCVRCASSLHFGVCRINMRSAQFPKLSRSGPSRSVYGNLVAIPSLPGIKRGRQQRLVLYATRPGDEMIRMPQETRDRLTPFDDER